GVLDVDVDLPAAQGRVAHERAAEVEAALHRHPGSLDRLRQQLAQHALLREVLRADDHPVAAAAGGEEGERAERDRRPRHRGGRRRRSTVPRIPSAASASAAAGNAPARMVRLSTIATPRKMKTPRPPAPMAAAMVARPIPMTVASRIPARMTLAA